MFLGQDIRETVTVGCDDGNMGINTKDLDGLFYIYLIRIFHGVYLTDNRIC